MEIRILGPLEVFEGKRHVEISSRKQRMLLTVLALASGVTVSADHLMGELWGDHPPATGLKTLHYHVATLRHTLEPKRKPTDASVIATRPTGYVLTLPAASIDAAPFEIGVCAARRLLAFEPALAATTIREALSLWRGSIPSEVLEAPLAGLEELRLAALEDRIDLDLARGLHHELIPELQALVATHPLREHWWGQLMIALYRSDRQAGALSVYEQLRSYLREEMEIEPCPEVQRIKQSILRQDSDLVLLQRARRAR